MSAPRPYDVVTFDCYGTLIDWDGGIRAAFAEILAETGAGLDPRHVLEVYEEIEAQVEAERYRRYREVLTETTRRIARRLGWALPETRAAFLAESLPRWIPFPDTNAALERLFKAGYRLGILSNVDDDLLSATRRHFTVDFDLIVTAQQVRSYKPGHAHFLKAKDKIGGKRWLHAAQSNFHDIAPATALGIDNAWVNRGHETGGVKPMYEVNDLAGLADLLT